MEIIQFLLANSELLWAGLTTIVTVLVGFATLWVAATPEPRDDEIVNKVRGFLESVSFLKPSSGAGPRAIADDEE